MFNIPNGVRFFMTERLVEIPVERKVRERLKIVKGTLTYSQFLRKVLSEYRGECNG